MPWISMPRPCACRGSFRSSRATSRHVPRSATPGTEEAAVRWRASRQRLLRPHHGRLPARARTSPTCSTGRGPRYAQRHRSRCWAFTRRRSCTDSASREPTPSTSWYRREPRFRSDLASPLTRWSSRSGRRWSSSACPAPRPRAAQSTSPEFCRDAMPCPCWTPHSFPASAIRSNCGGKCSATAACAAYGRPGIWFRWRTLARSVDRRANSVWSCTTANSATLSRSCPYSTSSGDVRHRVDLGDPDHLIAVEYDGSSHLDPRRLRADRTRHNWLSERGWSVRYFTASDLYQNPHKILETVAAARQSARRSRANHDT